MATRKKRRTRKKKRAKKRNWIKGAIKRPGAFRAKAKRAGMTTTAYARKVLANKSRYSSRTVKQARLALTLGKMRRKRRVKRRRKTRRRRK